MAFAGFLSIAVPGCVKGLPLDDPETRRFRKTVEFLYKWLLTSWIHQGSDWTLSRIKCLCDWALYYSVQSDYSEPELLSGSPGGTRDGWASFRFLNGFLLSDLRPTRGPLKREAREKTPFLFYEFYSIKGALPLPSEERCKSSFKKHRETLSSGGQTPPEMLAGAQRFMSRYREVYPPDESSAHFTINSSAVLESSRSKGGRGTWLRSYLKKFKEDDFSLSEMRKTGPLYDCFGRFLCTFPPDCYEDLFAEVLALSPEEFTQDASKATRKRALYDLLDIASERGFRMRTPLRE